MSFNRKDLTDKLVQRGQRLNAAATKAAALSDTSEEFGNAVNKFLKNNNLPTIKGVDINKVLFLDADRAAIKAQLKNYFSAESVPVPVQDMKKLAETDDFGEFTKAIGTPEDGANFTLPAQVKSKKLNFKAEVAERVKRDYVVELFNLANTGTYAEFIRKWNTVSHVFEEDAWLGLSRKPDKLGKFLNKYLADIINRQKTNANPTHQTVTDSLTQSSAAVRSPQVSPITAFNSRQGPANTMTPEQRQFLATAKYKLEIYLEHLEKAPRWFYDSRKLQEKIDAVRSLSSSEDLATYNSRLADASETIKKHRPMILFGFFKLSFTSIFGPQEGQVLVKELQKLQSKIR